jgi:O-antigen ligase
VVLCAFFAFFVTAAALRAPHWWISAVIVVTFVSFPSFFPSQIRIFGSGIYLHEIPLILTAIYFLFCRPANRKTDLCAAGIAVITVIGIAHGLWNGHPLPTTMNDARSILMMTLYVFIVGRIASAVEVHAALRAVKITLWVSFGLILLSTWNVVNLNARTEDAALFGATVHARADVERVLGPTTHLASATLAIVIALWAIKPELSRRTVSYLIPALGITAIGFSRSAVVLVAITLLLAPIFYRPDHSDDRRKDYSGVSRAIFIAVGAIIVFELMGAFLAATAGIPGMNYIGSIYSAYSTRVLEGFSSDAQQFDYSLLYRQSEVKWLKSGIIDHELIGNGFGFLYRPPVGKGFTATSGTYYAHHFYWWAVAKVGWFGLCAYMITFVTPVLHAIFARGGFALRSAAAAAVVGYMATMVATPIPEDAFGAPAFGILLGIALLTRNPQEDTGISDIGVKEAQMGSRPNA